ncbi:hypothetical protein RJT34_11791 [Clitoria ternatea]|uniref:DUF3741 domain-containing protein n=1 Tax=Clitoria ternatea TaxID=43366 RepID=A0AAN9JL41_CLITE
MKLLTASSSSSSSSSYYSSSSPSSSSSTLNFDPTLCHSKSASAGCLIAILRRILCSGSIPTHPSDQIRKLDSISNMGEKVQELNNTKQNTEPTTTTTTTTTSTSSTTITPGLVARLMGLDSMVETTSEATSSSSLSRSKSMNSVDYLSEYKGMEGLHRRVKSSSFRELPTFHLLENDNFLVLSFESGSGESNKEFKSKGRRNEKGSSELKQKKKNKREKLHDEKGNLSDMSCVSVGNDGKHELQFANTLPLFKDSSLKECIDSEAERFSHYMKHKEVTNGEKVKRRKKETTSCAEKKVETECSSEDSSPVSVFDFDREAPGTEVNSFGVGVSWRRKLSPELENDQIYVLHCDSNLMAEERKVKAIENNKHEVAKKKVKQGQESLNIWGEICKLVEHEIGSNLLDDGMKKKQGDFESISADFESEIFDHLLNELIDQLVGNPLEALQLQSL